MGKKKPRNIGPAGFTGCGNTKNALQIVEGKRLQVLTTPLEPLFQCHNHPLKQSSS